MPQLSSESCIVIASTVHMNNFTMDGTNNLAGGTHGILFVDCASDAGSCNYINISNIRRKDSSSNGGTHGFTVMFGMWGRQMLNVCQKNIAADLSPSYGFYFRNVRVLTLENCTYPGTGTALDIDGTHDQGGNAGQGCWDVAMLNTFFQAGSTISAPGMVRVAGFQRYNTSYAPFMWFDTTADQTANGALPGISLGGTISGGIVSAYVNIVTGNGQPTASFPGDLPIGSLT